MKIRKWWGVIALAFMLSVCFPMSAQASLPGHYPLPYAHSGKCYALPKPMGHLFPNSPHAQAFMYRQTHGWPGDYMVEIRWTSRWESGPEYYTSKSLSASGGYLQYEGHPAWNIFHKYKGTVAVTATWRHHITWHLDSDVHCVFHVYPPR